MIKFKQSKENKVFVNVYNTVPQWLSKRINWWKNESEKSNGRFNLSHYNEVSQARGLGAVINNLKI